MRLTCTEITSAVGSFLVGKMLTFRNSVSLRRKRKDAFGSGNPITQILSLTCGHKFFGIYAGLMHANESYI
jgi:hypothetical protein